MRACIGSQSATIARTSSSTLVMRALSAAIAACGWRSISRCISDSAVPSPTPASLPALSRDKRITGCPSTCTPMPASASAIVTESTRNGMSSFTICRVVCAESAGLNRRTLAFPRLRVRANSSMSATSSAQPAALRLANSSASMRR